MICAGVVMLALSSCGSGGKENVLPPTVEVKTTMIEAGGRSQYIYVKASSSWKITLTSVDGGAPVDWIIAAPSSGSGSTDVTLKVEENESEQERSAVLTVENSAGKASKTISQKGKKPEIKPDPDPTPEPKPNETGWLELPSVPAGTDFFAHSMTIGSVKTRNYSFIWDYDNLVAPWVAYPLSRWNVGTGSRSDAWGLDPLLDEDKQPVLHFRGYSVGNSGRYDRGHQLPSADWPNIKGADPQKNPNAMTFYGTNMTPQLNGFNGGIWANLEGKVRSWANESDTLYVVTGCVIDYKDGETVKYALDNNGKKVTVPTGYYKVVLRYRANSTFGYSGYSACAILFDHKVYSDKRITSEYSMSVDDLEKKTGIDVFVNLPAKVGEETTARIEAEEPKDVAWWWR